MSLEICTLDIMEKKSHHIWITDMDSSLVFPLDAFIGCFSWGIFQLKGSGTIDIYYLNIYIGDTRGWTSCFCLQKSPEVQLLVSTVKRIRYSVTSARNHGEELLIAEDNTNLNSSMLSIKQLSLLKYATSLSLALAQSGIVQEQLYHLSLLIGRQKIVYVAGSDCQLGKVKNFVLR